MIMTKENRIVETKDLIVDVYLERNDPREILISKSNINFYELKRF